MNQAALTLGASAAKQVAAGLLASATTPEEMAAAAALLARSLERLDAPELAQGLLAALRQAVAGPQAQVICDALWQAWSATRHPALGALLVELERPASSPAALVVLSLLQLGCCQQLAAGGPECVEPLLQFSADPTLADRASAALASLSNPQARDEVCRWVIEHDHPTARQAALSGGFAPQDPARRALFYLLSEQWQKYETLDFDARLLEAVYAAGSEALRSQISSLAARRGWAGYVQAIAAGRMRRRLAELAEYEWEAVQAILGRSARWAEAWQLAQAAPPAWSARLLRGLHEASWTPPPLESEAFAALSQAAAACWNAPEPQARRVLQRASLFGHRRQITAISLCESSGLLASASADKTIRLWSLADNRLLKTLEGHTDFVLSLAADPRGEWLASGSADKTVRLWNLPDGRPGMVLGGHSGRVNHLAAAPQGNLLVSGDEHSLYFWDPERAQPLQTLRNQFNGLNALAFSADGSLLVTGDNDRTVRLWSLPEGRLLRTLLTPIVGWALSADGRRLASSSSYSALQLWRLPEGELESSLPGRANTPLLAFSPDGRWLACADRSNVLLWDLSLPNPGSGGPQTLKGGVGLACALAFSPDSALLAAGGQDRMARLWQLPSGLPLPTLEGYTAPVKSLAFTQPVAASDEQCILASADELSLQLWTVDNLPVLFHTPAARLQPAQIEPRLAEAASGALADPALAAWLRFSLALARWQRRYDIEIQENTCRIPIGDYDIEIQISTSEGME